MRPQQSFLHLLLGDKGSAPLQHMRINRVSDLKATFERHYTMQQLMSLRREHLNFTERYMYEQAGEALERSSHNPMAIYRYSQATIDKIMALLNYLQMQHSVLDGSISDKVKTLDLDFQNKAIDVISTFSGKDPYKPEREGGEGIGANNYSHAQAMWNLEKAMNVEKDLLECCKSGFKYPDDVKGSDILEYPDDVKGSDILGYPADMMFNNGFLVKMAVAHLDAVVGNSMFKHVAPPELSAGIEKAINERDTEGEYSYAIPGSHTPAPPGFNILVLSHWTEHVLYTLDGFNLPRLSSEQLAAVEDALFGFFEFKAIRERDFFTLKQIEFLTDLKFITPEAIAKKRIPRASTEKSSQYFDGFLQQEVCQRLHLDAARSMQFFVSSAHNLDMWTMLQQHLSSDMLLRTRINNLIPASILRNLPDLYYSLRELSVYLPYDFELYYYRAVVASLLGFEQAALNDLQYFAALYSAFEHVPQGQKLQLMQMTSGDIISNSLLYARYLQNIPQDGAFVDYRGNDIKVKYTGNNSYSFPMLMVDDLNDTSIYGDDFITMHLLREKGLTAVPLSTQELTFAHKNRLEFSRDQQEDRCFCKVTTYFQLITPAIALTRSVTASRFTPQDRNDAELCRLNVPKSRQLFLEKAVRRDDSALLHAEDITTPSLTLSKHDNCNLNGKKALLNDDLMLMLFYLSALTLNEVLHEYKGVMLQSTGNLTINDIVSYHKDRAPHSRILAQLIRNGDLGEASSFYAKTIDEVIKAKQDMLKRNNLDDEAKALIEDVIKALKYVAAEEERYKEHHKKSFYKLVLITQSLRAAAIGLPRVLAAATFTDEAHNALYPDFPQFDRQSIVSKSSTFAALKAEVQGKLNLTEVEPHPCNPLVLNPKTQISFAKFMELLPEAWADFVDKFTQSLDYYAARLDHIDDSAAALDDLVAAAAAGAAAGAGAGVATGAGSTGADSAARADSASGKLSGHQRYGHFEAAMNLGFEHMMVNFFFDQLYKPWLDYSRVPEFNGFVPVDVDYVRFIDNTARNYPMWHFDDESETHCLTLNTHLNAMEPAMQSWVLHHMEKQLKKHPVEGLSFKADPVLEPQQSLSLADGSFALNTADIKVMVFISPSEAQEQIIRDFTAPNPIEDGRTLEFPDAQVNVFGSRDQQTYRNKAQRQISYIAFEEETLDLQELMDLDETQSAAAKANKGGNANTKAKANKGPNKSKKKKNKANKAKQPQQPQQPQQSATAAAAVVAAGAAAATAAATAATAAAAAAAEQAARHDRLLGIMRESGMLQLVVYAPMLMLLDDAQQACSKVQHYLLSLVGPAFYHHVIKSVRFTSFEQGCALEEKLGTNVTSFNAAMTLADIKKLQQGRRALVMGINDLPDFARVVSPAALVEHGLDCVVGYKVTPRSLSDHKSLAGRGDFNIAFDPEVTMFDEIYEWEEDQDERYRRINNAERLDKAVLSAVIGEYDLDLNDDTDKSPLSLIPGVEGYLNGLVSLPNRLDVLYGVSDCMPLIEDFYQNKMLPPNLLPYSLCNVDYLRSVGASPLYLPIYFPYADFEEDVANTRDILAQVSENPEVLFALAADNDDDDDDDGDDGYDEIKNDGHLLRLTRLLAIESVKEHFTYDTLSAKLTKEQKLARIEYINSVAQALYKHLKEHGMVEQVEITGYALGLAYGYIDLMLWNGVEGRNLIHDFLRQNYNVRRTADHQPFMLALHPF